MEGHFARFRGAAQWNLRQDFNQPVSFVHGGTATGLELGLDYSYTIWDNLALNAGFAYKNWRVSDGYDFVILNNGQALATKLNEVNWDSQLYRVGMAYNF
jgi:hypothetical protein